MEPVNPRILFFTAENTNKVGRLNTLAEPGLDTVLTPVTTVVTPAQNSVTPSMTRVVPVKTKIAPISTQVTGVVTGGFVEWTVPTPLVR